MSGAGSLARAGGFAVGLVATFGAAFGVGAAVGPLETGAADPAHSDHPPRSAAAESHVHDTPGAADDGGSASHAPAGLASSDGGYTLVLDRDRRPAGRAVPLRFTITGPNGEPVTRYAADHGKRLHVIVVRRDLAGYRHLHPSLDAASGRWSTRLLLPAAGDYRVYADFTPADGEPLTLGADLHVAGAYDPRPLPQPSVIGTVDGYSVRLHGRLRTGAPSPLTLTVRQDGQPVGDLQPYLNARGHLVVLRDGDLAYLHVHPVHASAADSGPGVDFVVEVPTAGRYRLYFDFRHGDRVRTAEFTARATR